METEKKIAMKRTILNSSFAIILLILFIGFAFTACKKDTLDINDPSHETTYYATIQEFLDQHAVASEYFTFNSSTGGTFNSVKGSQIIVSPNSFAAGGFIITGNVTLEFKDIYDKSDMIFSQMPTTLMYGGILESGGMFYIRVKQGNLALDLAPGKSITIKLPLDSGSSPVSAMAPYVFVDSTLSPGWVAPFLDSSYVSNDSLNYIYTLMQLYPPLDSGTWYNCDDPTAFQAYSPISLTAHQLDSSNLYGTIIFLVFPGFNAVVSLSSFNSIDFTYNYVPIGLNFTMLAIGVKESNLYYFKQDFILNQIQTMNFSMTQTTEADLINLITSLNN